MKPFKQCRCGAWCATGYCLDCRRKDELAKAKIREEKRLQRLSKVPKIKKQKEVASVNE
jgi:hypothetical protein